MKLEEDTITRSCFSRFSIDAILNSKPSKSNKRLVRPWLVDSLQNSIESSHNYDDHCKISNSHLYYSYFLLNHSHLHRFNKQKEVIYNFYCKNRNNKNLKDYFKIDCSFFPKRTPFSKKINYRETPGSHSFTDEHNSFSNFSEYSKENHDKNTNETTDYPLQALFAMAKGGQDSYPKVSQMNKGLMASFTNKHHMMMRHLLKKHRKTRTAFTNEQLVQLEKKFKLQKYLTPADRDEIASTLKLSNSQVITWFQNRRAKLKRDMEELKADVRAATSLSVT